MNQAADFVGVVGAIGLSVVLALWLEWVSLRALMKLMPAKTVEPDGSHVAMIRVDEAKDGTKAA